MTSPDTSGKMAKLRAQAQAAAWMARLNNAQHGVETEQELQHWINESEEHAKAWELAEVVWKETGILASEGARRPSVGDRLREDQPRLGRLAATRSMDLLSGIVLALCGVTTAVLSTRGAYALFGGSWLIASAFAIVVQFIVLVALWQFPRKPLGTQALLMSTCAVAVFLSIGSTYYATYRIGADDAVARTRDRMVRALLAIEIQEANEAAEHSGPESSEPDPGSAEWRPKGLDATRQVERVSHTRTTVSDSIAELTRPDLTMEDLQRIYDQVESQASLPRQALQRPEVGSRLRGFFAEVLKGYKMGFGMSGPVPTLERVRAVNSLVAVSIMEVLSLMVAVIRAAMLDAHLRREALDGAKKQVRATQRVQVSIADPDAEAAAEKEWEVALNAEIHSSGSESQRLVFELLPGYGALSRLTGKGLYCPTAVFDPLVFSRRPVALQGALTTGAVLCTSEGDLIPGARWEQWIRFLLARLPKASEASHRLSGPSCITGMEGQGAT
jgi:hypothetical protein